MMDMGGTDTSAREVTLVGREEACSRISALLGAARQRRSGALVISGDPGIGKSALCTWAVAHAAGMHVVSVQAIESEFDLPFAGVSELCAGELDRVDLLPSPQKRALEAALARRETRQGDRFAVGAALLSLLAVVRERQSLLVVVDDAQWLDPSSADAVLFAARRLRAEGVALLVATRPGGVFAGERTGLPGLTLRGLDRDAARALLKAAHGVLPGDVAELLADRTGGNPLALLELPLVLNRAQLAGQQRIDEPLPVGPTLVRAMCHRLAALPEETARALLVAAASGAGRVQPVIDALSALGLERSVLEAAERAGVLSIVGDVFEFRHPLLRSAIYHRADGPARRSVHEALAQISEGDIRVWHLAYATVGENEAVAAMLERVGLSARQRGSPTGAAAALEHAARLSAPGEGRVRRLTEAARDVYVAGRPTAALGLLDTALACSYDVVQRADIQHVRGRILVLQGAMDSAYRLLVEEAQLVGNVDCGRAAMMLAEACMDCFLSADVRRAVAVARDACKVAAGAGQDVQAFAGVMLAAASVLGGDRAEAGMLLDRFLPLLRAADPLTEAGELVGLAAQCYFWLERDDVASELLRGLTTSAREASAPAALLLPLCCTAELSLRVGRWEVAAAQFEEAADLGQEMAQSVFVAYAHQCLARLAAMTGDEVRCRDHSIRATRLVEEHNNELGRLYIYSALGLLELGLGNMDAAIEHLEEAHSLAQGHELAEPNVVHWQADLIEAHVRAGHTSAAHRALSTLERQAQRTGGDWALGTSARCHGMLADETRLNGWFDAALKHLETVGNTFEVFRTHLCHGERLRRLGRRREARRALRLAIDGFDELGAKPWVTRAENELRATGASPKHRLHDRADDELTAHELRVALIVASGASNREAAAALFLSPKTIEFHLAHIYRKLGVRSRTELAGVAARQGWLEEAIS
jgi:DNA-binding CsgD family transcriptional regulator